MKEYILRKLKHLETDYSIHEKFKLEQFIQENLENINDEQFVSECLVKLSSFSSLLKQESSKIDFNSESYRNNIYERFKTFRTNYNDKEFKDFVKHYNSIKKHIDKPFRSKCNDLRDEIIEVYAEELQKDGYKDKEDKNHLNWGGTRASSRVLNNPLRTSPMFFRRNGFPMDLVDLYKDKAVFVINNGPSFKDVDHSKLKLPGIITYGMNNGAQMFRPNLWSCVDDPSRFLESIWADPSIMKLIPMAHFEKPIWDKQNDRYSEKLVGDFPNVIGFRRNEKFDENTWLFEDTINWGNHGKLGGGRSVLVAIMRICHLLGFKRIYLLGCDFEMSDDKKYWFDEQRTATAINNNNNSYRIMIEYFEKLKPKFEEVGVGVYNLNPNSHLKVFEFADFDNSIQNECINNSDSTYGMYINRKNGEKHD